MAGSQDSALRTLGETTAQVRVGHIPCGVGVAIGIGIDPIPRGVSQGVAADTDPDADPDADSDPDLVVRLLVQRFRSVRLRFRSAKHRSGNAVA